jgi:acetyl-CoA acetyltransferase
VDGPGVASFSLAPDHAVDAAWRLGLRVRWLMDTATGGASAVDMLQQARRAVEAGDADTVLLVAGDVSRAADFRRLVDAFNAAARDNLAPIPTGGANALFAPGAVYRDPLTLDAYLQEPLVADLLCRLDCVPVVSGADTIVVQRGKPGMRMRSVVALHNYDQQESDGLTTGLAQVATRLWDGAGAGPEDVDVVSVYDDYPAMVLAQLDDLGFALDRDLKRLARRVRAHSPAVNASGGAAGEMHAVVEVVRQLRGTAGDRQVAEARLGVVTGYGMVAYRYGACANATVLEAAP